MTTLDEARLFALGQEHVRDQKNHPREKGEKQKRQLVRLLVVGRDTAYPGPRTGRRVICCEEDQSTMDYPVSISVFFEGEE